MSDAFVTAAITIAALMTLTWLISGAARDASIVDLIWGLGFVLVAWTVYLTSRERGSPLVVVLVTLWGLRLSTYLAWRNLGKGEDYRYQTMRRQHGERFFWMSLFTVFGLQGVLMWLVSLPLQAVVSEAGSAKGWLTYAGILLWGVGLFFETMGDLQLARFKADPTNSGKVMDRGLWRYTRHPNYFGDFCVWWGLYLIALEAGHWWTIIGPLVMTTLLIKYSGAGLLEKTIGRRRPGYEEYIRRTNAFFPGPRRQARDAGREP
ncbi:MAG TPA: DUF1295 domain-containing protein [Acidimicrobiia bacterium]|nr:DUF1295 domain-containing protein [Acidimicrobiia bacterium]